MKNKIHYSLLLLLFLPMLTFASTSGPSTPQTTFFDMAPNDLSMQMLAVLFGDVGGLLPVNDENVVGIMFRVFNQTVLVLGTIVMLYTLFISTVNTAQEGEIMGKKWSSVWIPLRTISGVSLLVPMSSGYSLIQVATMWVVVQGIAGADLMWQTVMDYYAGNTTNVAATNTRQEFKVANASSFMQNLAQAGACEATFNVYARHKMNCYNLHSLGGASWCGERINYSYSYTYLTVYPTPDSRYSPYVRWSYPILSSTTGLFFFPNMSNNMRATVNSFSNYCNNQANNYNFAGASGYTGNCARPSQTNVGICGSFEVRVNNAKDQDGNNVFTSEQLLIIMNAKLAALKAAMDKLRPVYLQAAQITRNEGRNGDIAPTRRGWVYDRMKSVLTTYVENSGNGPLTDAINAYNSSLSNTLAAHNIRVTPSAGWTELAAVRGWMNAGGFYYHLANSLGNNDAIAVIQANPTYTGSNTKDTNLAAAWGGNGWAWDGCDDTRDAWQPPYTGLSHQPCSLEDGSPSAWGRPRSGVYSVFGRGTWNFFEIYRGTVQGLNNAMNDFGTAAGSQKLMLTSKAPEGDAHDFMQQGVFNLGSGIVDFVLSVINDNQTPDDALTQDPIVHISKAGHTLLVVTEACFIAGAIFMIGANIASGVVSFFAPGVGTVMAIALESLMLFVAPVLMSFMMLTWVASATMAYYLPMIPYILFLFGSIGWIIGVLESMVAAPLVALGLVVPSQDELGRAGHALMLVTNIFLRPTLMILGFVASIYMIRIGVYLLNVSFTAALAANAGGVTLFGSFAVLGMYFALLMTICQKCFGLIHEIPDKVLRWIGHHGQEQFGESQGLQQAQQGFDQSSQKGQQSAGGLGKAAMGRAEQNRAGRQERAMQGGGGGGKGTIQAGG